VTSVDETDIRVLLVDDQELFREGVRVIVDAQEGMAVVGTAGDGLEAVRLVDELAPDVVLMDLRMPEVDGVEATRRIRAEHPEVHVVVLTTYADDESVFSALQAGARGYLTKDAGAEEIARAIARVAAGEALLDPTVQARLLDRFDADRLAPPAPAPGTLGLTARERQVVTLIADGLSNAEIAERLVVEESTVKTHVNRIFAKTGVRDRAQAVRYAYREGLATPPSA
jgi:DNA-binding NarL/FixJ family response regulator